MIPTLTNLEELRESNDILNNPLELQNRIAEDGYLFFRQLQDPVMLTELRRQLLTTMQEGGWIKQGTNPLDGIAEPGVQCTEGDLEYTDVYHQVYRNQLFHESAHSDVPDFLVHPIHAHNILSPGRAAADGPGAR